MLTRKFADNNNNQVKIASLGGIEAIIKAMNKHQDSAGVQASGSWALLNIGWSKTDLQMKIESAVAEQVVKRAMSASIATSTTKEKGQQLLDRLKKSDCLKRTETHVFSSQIKTQQEKNLQQRYVKI